MLECGDKKEKISANENFQKGNEPQDLHRVGRRLKLIKERVLYSEEELQNVKQTTKGPYLEKTLVLEDLQKSSMPDISIDRHGFFKIFPSLPSV